MRRSRAAGGLTASRKLERGPNATKRPYPLRGRVRYGYCNRRMEGTPRATRTYYRCAGRSLVPGSPALDEHPKNVYLPETAVLSELNPWLDSLFDRDNVDQTVAALLASQGGTSGQHGSHEAAKKRVADAEARLRRFQQAIEAGVDPAALVESINDAQAQRAAARAELEGTPAPDALTDAEVYARIDSLGDVVRILDRARPAEFEELYDALGLEMIYQPEARALDVKIQPPRRGSERVRGATCTLTTRLHLPDTRT